MTRNLIQATPFFGVRSIEAAVQFYRDVLGFKIVVEGPIYAYVCRERAAIRLLLARPEDGPFQLGTAYVDLLDLESYCDQRKEALSVLPAKDVYGPVDQPYFQRELIIRDPDGNRIFFGQGIGPNADQWQGY